MTLLVTLLCVSVLVFFAFQIIPGDPAVLRLGVDATPEQIEALREEMGLNRHIMVRYAEWIGELIAGDMGHSYTHGVSVRELLEDRLLITGGLMAFGFVLTIAIAIPIGLLISPNRGSSARRSAGTIKGIAAVISQFVMAVPPLFLGLLLTFIFGATLRLFIPSEFVSFHDSVTGHLFYMLFPALAIALPKAAMTIRLIRSAVGDELGRDYVQTAISRGNAPKDVLYQHVLPNILAPVVTFLTLTLIMMITDSIVIEQVFSIPGAGRLLIRAIGTRDYPVVQALVVIIAFFVMTLHTLTDLICKMIDPRITL